MTVSTKSRKPAALPTIKAATFARGTLHATGEVFYRVQSDRDATTWYTLSWSSDQHRWLCSCPARTLNCKHARGLGEHLAARQDVQPELAPVSPAIACVACGVPVAATKAQRLNGQDYCPPCCEDEVMRRRESAPLPNRGFSLLKRS